MTISLTFNAPTVPDQAEATFGRLRVPINAPIVGGGGSPADGVAPVVSLISPASLQLEAETAVVIEVTDNVGLRRALIAAVFDTLGTEELVHNGDRFAPAYSARSTRLAIAGGWRYTLQRNGGWPSSPALQVYAIDTSGAEA